MNRPIKFRAWDKEEQEMHGFELRDALSTGIDFYDDDAPLMQFTGLLDKNGKEIYEGDVVKQVMYDTDKSWYEAEVIFNRGRFCLNTGTIPEDLIPELCEIIGNIYENPNLLQAGSKEGV